MNEQNDVREDDVEKLALEWCKGIGEDGFVRTGDDYDVHELPAYIAGYNKAKENTYTELESFINNEDYHTEGELGNSCIDVKTLLHFIQSLKQHK